MQAYGEISCSKFIEADLNSVFSMLANNCAQVTAVIEQVHSSPQMGVRSAFSFGENYGTWKTLCHLAGAKVLLVRPQVWQKSLNLTGLQGADRKNAIKTLAKDKFPDQSVTLATADSLMLLEYSKRMKL